MQSRILASNDIVIRYSELFVNRRAYTIQSSTPDKEKHRCYYYRPKEHPSLSRAILRKHLEGTITIGLYAINPETQRCKWVAIDADYSEALTDLLKLQWELRQDGVDAALEKSRRGGHLWIFAEQPLLASDCRQYIHSIAQRLKVPIKGPAVRAETSSQPLVLADGIEVFPKQDRLNPGEFGNAIRGPLGVHRATGKRYWFYGADYTLEDQIAYLCRLKRITEDDISRFVSGVAIPRNVPVPAKPARRQFLPNPGRREFSILAHITGKRRKSGRNYFTRCPSCARQGHDRSGDNLAISISDPRKYRCWAGCTKEMIRAALGQPIPMARTQQ
jgi:hypothetical protein